MPISVFYGKRIISTGIEKPVISLLQSRTSSLIGY